MSRRYPPRGGFFGGGDSPFARLPSEPSFPNVRMSSRAVLWIVLLALVGLVLLLLQPFATTYTDWLWFRALGYGNVFGTRFRAQLFTFVVFALIFWLVGAVNVLVALSSSRRLTSIGIRQRLLTQPLSILALLAIFLLGLLFGSIAAGSWQTILAYVDRTQFGLSDPIWHKDVSFYVFTLPLLRFLWGWALGVVIVLGLAVVVLYSYRAGLQRLALPARAIRHLSLLAAAFALLLAAHYRLDLYELLLGHRGFVFGAGFADVTARIPAYWIMVVLMIALAALLLFNLRPASLLPFPVALTAWFAGVFVLLVVLPGLVQRFSVQPDEIHRETPYIANEIAFTRQGFGLQNVTDKPFAPQAEVTPDAIAANPQTVENARLWDPQFALPDNLEATQSLRTYYDFSPIAVDRYTIDGHYLQLLLAAREISSSKLQQAGVQAWVSLKLQYTHGYGVVAARANQASDQGNPVLTLQNIPPQGDPAVSQPAIYFGRNSATGDYVLVDSKQAEFDYPGTPDQYTHWTGQDGVYLSSALRRLAFALRFGDLNIMVSDNITGQTQVLFQRQIQDRVSALAPFLTVDSDPYVVISGGRVYWIVDAYTVSDHFPYSQPYSPGGSNDQTFAGENYVRNSVKVVVDAYTGKTDLYQVDQQDPVIRTYARIFPGLFKPFSEMPVELQSHVRYARDLFTAQSQVFTLYHVQDPTVFYTREDLWNVATQTTGPGQPAEPIRPFYVIMRLPGEPSAEFVIILPYTPNGKTNMIGYLAARADAPHYGELVDFRFPKENLVVGPQQVDANIDQTPTISSQFSLLNQQGSAVVRGNLLVLPIENSILYVEPIYLQASGGTRIPQLKKVIVATGQRVAMDDTLDKALADLLGSNPPPTTNQPSGAAPAGSVAQLIQSANQHYQAAQAALKRGDFTAYASEIQQVGQILQQLQKLQRSPSPAASPKS